MKLGEIRKVLTNWLGIKNGTVYWIARVEVTEGGSHGQDKGALVDIYMVKGRKKTERYIVFYDYLNDYVRYAYDFEDWEVNGSEDYSVVSTREPEPEDFPSLDT